jgi:hypothetical protein
MIHSKMPGKLGKTDPPTPNLLTLFLSDAIAAPLAGRFCAEFANFDDPTKRPASGAAKQLYVQLSLFSLASFADAFQGIA